MTLAGRVALVTGGAKRIGRAIALELARAGCDVAIQYRESETEAWAIAVEIRRLGRRCSLHFADFDDRRSTAALVEGVVGEMGCLGILVNNAAVFRISGGDSLEAFDTDRWERMLRINLIAPAALAHYAAPHLRAGGQGRIVNLCDISADRPWPEHLAYCASKAALVNLTKSLALALAPGVQVNGVAPGIGEFPGSYTQEVRDRLVSRVPAGRPGSPAEMARVVRFLAEDADYVTGQIVMVDGGRSLV